MRRCPACTTPCVVASPLSVAPLLGTSPRVRPAPRTLIAPRGGPVRPRLACLRVRPLLLRPLCRRERHGLVPPLGAVAQLHPGESVTVARQPAAEHHASVLDLCSGGWQGEGQVALGPGHQALRQ
eukprot:scaffold99339_cov66-Phaeocystis_antarctica.AAC.5